MPQNPLDPRAPAGTITGSASTAYNLIDLIRAQLDPDGYGAYQELNIQADFLLNSANVNIGKITPIGGDISATNYGYALSPGASRTYRASFPGNAALGLLRVFSTSAFTLHVETML